MVTCTLPVLHFSQLLRLLSFTQTDSLSDLCNKQEQQLRIDNTTMLWNLKKTTPRQSNRHNRRVWKHPVGFDSGFGCHTCRKKEVKSLNEVNILHSSGQTDPICDWTVRSSWLLSDCTSKENKEIAKRLSAAVSPRFNINKCQKMPSPPWGYWSCILFYITLQIPFSKHCFIHPEITILIPKRYKHLQNNLMPR